MSCNICGENRFGNAAQSSCHSSKNHAEFSCSCDKKFMTEDSLKDHQTEMREHSKGCDCSNCCRSFKKEEGLHSHKRTKGHWDQGERNKAQETTGKVFCDDKCGRSFNSKAALDQHRYHFQDKAGVQHVCFDCTKEFPKGERLAQHRKDTGHISKPTNPAKAYIDTVMKGGKVTVGHQDKKESVGVVKNHIEPIMKHVRAQKGGKMYSADVRKAGSHAIGAKIGKADEFDTNIPLNVKVKDIITRGPLPYIYEDKVKGIKDGHSPKNLNVPRQLVDNPKGVIPLGQGRVIVDDKNVPAHLTHNGDLIAHKVHEDFHKKVSTALKELDMKDVHLSRNAHGPALTMTIKQPNGHDINVDMTATIPSSRPVTDHGWPRPDTKKAFPAETINAVKNVGTHLVPKGDETWNLSQSKAEKALLEKIDTGNGCRRQVMKYCKRETQKCASGNKDGLPGVSSHIIKHALLWSCEKHHQPDYWQQKNMDRCLVDTMKNLEDSLRCGKLPNYFNTMDNVLKGKDRTVLNTLADHFKQERVKLIHMNN